MVVGKLRYEELRRQRLEENKKRMEQLHLPQLSLALKKHSSTPTPSPVKRATPRIIRTEMVAVRRSNRVANKPAPLYTQIITYERLELPRRNLKNGMYKRRDLSNRVYASEEARELAISKAQEVESGLGRGLPVHFCRRNLPRRDETVTLVDEEGEEYPTVYLARKAGLSGGWRGFSIDHETVTLVDEEGEEYPTVYLARKAGLSGGWRGFSIDHGLVDGDAIVFQLIRRTVFKLMSSN